MNKTPTTLIIMDGFGLASASDDNAVTLAKTPVLDRLFKEYANTTLSASGLDVGLPAGQMGNSEVGHTNIGGGRVVFQDLPRISRAIDDGSFFKNEAYNKAMGDCLSKGSSLHLYGLLSDGGVHSHIQHLFALLQMAKDKGLTKVYVHCFLDGRDVPPSSGLSYVKALQEEMEKIGVGQIATISGRYYVMDRDRHWDRVQPAYEAMVLGKGPFFADPIQAVEKSYEQGETDEFMKLMHISEYADRMPDRLSGGQQQRVALARALVIKPDVLLMDEPLSNLDAKLRNQMRAEIIKLRQRIDTTFIYVTHDQTEAMTLGDRIVIMKDGFIQQIGTPQEVFNHPYNLFVATFIGTPQMNMFENAKLVKADGKYAVQLDNQTVVLSDEKQAKLAANNVAEQDVVLGVRPEHIELTAGGIEGKVDVSEMMGSTVHLHVTSMGRDVVLVVSTMNMTGAEVAALSSGSTVHFSFPGQVCHIFSKETGINLEA